MSFDKNVFINCPFDTQYRVLLNPLLFTILFIDLEPKIAETESSSQIRVQEIMNLIKNSRYSIHDISRSDPAELPRFNMPYEMGLDIGCQIFGAAHLQTKRCLILDINKSRYKKIVSDIGGQDIKDHNNDPLQLITKVREWFVKNMQKRLQSPNHIWEKYTEFIADIYEDLSEEGYTKNQITELSFSEFILLAKPWIAEQKNQKPPGTIFNLPLVS